jgi:hypothetical protein
MSDRTYLSVQISCEDVSWWEQWGLVPCSETPDPGSSCLVEDIEADWGGEILAKAAEAGLTYLATHNSGCEYSAAAWACYQGTWAAVDALETGELVVPVDEETGIPRPDAVANMERYLSIRHMILYHWHKDGGRRGAGAGGAS